jgi:HD-GYP domain-containing protein (c-di-GMP phosphodiesterase class II)
LSMAEPTIFGQSQRMERMARELGEELGYSPLWELEVATLLSQVGRVTIPNEVNALAETPHKLNAKEKRLLQSVPDIGSSLLGHIPGFERISEIVGYQNKRFDGTGHPAGQRSGKEIPLGSRIIRLVMDVLKLEEGGLNRRAALRQCKDMPGHHDPDLLELATQLFNLQEGALELLPLRDLRPGMLTCSSIMDSTGRVMVAPGLELTAPLLKSLENFHARVGLIEPFEVQLPTQGPPAA